MLKGLTKRVFYCGFLFVVLCILGLFLFVTDMSRRKINLTEDNIQIIPTKDTWTKDDITVTINYKDNKKNIKEYSFDGGKSWTKHNAIEVKSNQTLNIIVKDINDNEYKTTYNVLNIDREGPVVLLDSNVEVALNSKVNLKDFVTVYDKGSGVRDEVVITPPTIDTSVTGTYSFWVYAIDKLANKTIKQLEVKVVNKVPGMVIKGISLYHHFLIINKQEEVILTPNIVPKKLKNKTIKWQSSDDSVATVDLGGKVIGLKTGTTMISATTNNGLKDYCLVIVK